MKKILVSLLILCCSFAIFATYNNFSAKFVPVSYQNVTSGGTSDVSKYGIGAEISNKRYFYKGFFAEGGLSLLKYTYEGSYTDETTGEAVKVTMPVDDFVFSLGVGYSYQISDIVRATAHVDYVIVDDLSPDTTDLPDTIPETVLPVIRSSDAPELSVKAGFEFGFRFNDKLEATVGCDGVYGRQETTTTDGNGTEITTITNYYKLIPSVGISVNY